MMMESTNSDAFIPTKGDVFEVLKELNGSSVAVDYQNKIVKVEWDGIVDLATVNIILNKAADLIEVGHCDKLLLNRKNLKEFTTEARIWIKQDLLRNRAKKLVNKVVKVATVNSSTAMGGVFANFISTAIKLIFPKLSMVKFSSQQEGLDWLLS
ncbi:MAG: hypothetical protein ABJG78_08725 [Cyclobacteriaceae bacterium]